MKTLSARISDLENQLAPAERSCLTNPEFILEAQARGIPFTIWPWMVQQYALHQFIAVGGVWMKPASDVLPEPQSALFRWHGMPLLRFALQALQAGRSPKQIRRDIESGIYGLGTEESPPLHLPTWAVEPQREQVAADARNIVTAAEQILRSHGGHKTKARKGRRAKPKTGRHVGGE